MDDKEIYNLVLELPNHQRTIVSLVWMPVEAGEKPLKPLADEAGDPYGNPSAIGFFRQLTDSAGLVMARVYHWFTRFSPASR